MRSNFTLRLNAGQRGERLVEGWLQSRGIMTLPTYDFAAQGAPRMRLCGQHWAVPDILGARSGMSWWWEVKTLSYSPMNRIRKTHIHGIQRRLWDGYQTIGTTSGIPVFVLILEKESRELLSLPMAGAETFGCDCYQCLYEHFERCYAPLRRGIYWRRDAMTLCHTFSPEECATLDVPTEAA